MPDPDAEARQLLWPWVARPSRAQVVALICISCLALGPVAALAVLLRSDASPVDELVVAPTPDDSTSTITVTAIGVSPSTGELRVRVLVQPAVELVDDAGRLTQPVTLGVNDARGTVPRTYEAGEVPTPFEAAVPLVSGTITRYPVDQYEAGLLLALSTEVDDEQVPAPFGLGARATVDDFDLRAARPAAVDDVPGSFAVVEWEASRPGTTTVYAVWLMVLMWGLAVTGLLIVWSVLIWRVELPFWTFGYFVGVLFALPPLRDSLPGRPPPGTIFDFVSFYWSITIVGTSLILLLVTWVRRARGEATLRAIDPAIDPAVDPDRR